MIRLCDAWRITPVQRLPDFSRSHAKGKEIARTQKVNIDVAYQSGALDLYPENRMMG